MSTAAANHETPSRGAVWHRWEPHAHAPGTLFNDQFDGERGWPDYLLRLETCDPVIKALGVTDYYLTDRYSRVCDEKTNGRLKNVELVFPNIELRLDVGTIRGRWVNVHLLVSPEDPQHIDRVHGFLAQLRFRAFLESFACTPEDLTRLGRAANPELSDDRSALRYGAEQFKVSFDELRRAYEQSDWAQSNILIAVAGSKTDGTSGVRTSADATLRQEIERFAHVIFASSPAQREFWLGQRGPLGSDEIRERYGGLKPCLHGSDCHEPEKVGQPYDDRFSWIKGNIDFDTLRQAAIDPGGRAFVGQAPPQTGTPSQIIDRIGVSSAPWLKTPTLPLNTGLVAIIGARGSGKTALADMIARACDAFPDTSEFETSDRPSTSFLDRASELLEDATIKLTWRVGENCKRRLDGTDAPDFAYPRARYLSQQFVDKLCSAATMNDALLCEIERVIFESHPLTERDGTLDFSELLDLRSSRYRLARRREESAIVQLSERIGSELEKDTLVPGLKRDIATKERLIATYKTDRSRLVSKGSEQRVKRLTEVTEAAETVRSYLRHFSNQERSILALHDEVSDQRENQAPEHLRRTQERHSQSRLKQKDWQDFLLDYTGDVDAQIESYLKSSREAIKEWKGKKPDGPVDDTGTFIRPNVELNQLPLAVLEAETERIEKLVNADRQTQRCFSVISKKVVEETAALNVLKEKLNHAQSAKDRARQLQDDRDAAYRRVFDAISAEQQILVDLYAPLMQRLATASGTKKDQLQVEETAALNAETKPSRLRTGPGSCRMIARRLPPRLRRDIGGTTDSGRPVCSIDATTGYGFGNTAETRVHRIPHRRCCRLGTHRRDGAGGPSQAGSIPWKRQFVRTGRTCPQTRVGKR